MPIIIIIIIMNYFWSNLIQNFLETQLKDIIVDNMFYNEVISGCNFAANSDFVCFIIHSKYNLSLQGVTWNSRNWPIRCQNSHLICDITATDRIGLI